MHALWEFLLRHGYALLLGAVFVEQLGAPIPAVPVLAAMGALCGLGRFSLAVSIGVSMLGALLADWIWFEIGRRRGGSVLSFLCKLSLEPDSCVKKTHSVWDTYGPWTLLVAKFIPGINTVAPPLAGAAHMPRWRFLLTDALGSALWSGCFLSLGFLLRHEAEKALDMLGLYGGRVFAVALLGLAAWIAWKFRQRRRFLRDHAVARIQPDELLRRLDSGEALVLVDLRARFELEEAGSLLPGARWMEPEDVQRSASELAGLGELIFYCS